MQIYICNIKPYMDLRGIEKVTPSRQKRIHAFVRTEDKARCLLAGLMMREICGVTDDTQLNCGKHGKPCLPNGTMRFNISHSGDYVVMATAEHEVGIDIEKITPYPDSVAKRCFTENENAWLNRENSDEAFFRLWTAKESVMKACGLGLSLPPESFTVLPFDSAHVINGRHWYLDLFVHNGHVICCASESKHDINTMPEMKVAEIQ